MSEPSIEKVIALIDKATAIAEQMHRDLDDAPRDARVEELARSLYGVNGPDDIVPFFAWDVVRPDIREYYHALARKAIEVLGA